MSEQTTFLPSTPTFIPSSCDFSRQISSSLFFDPLGQNDGESEHVEYHSPMNRKPSHSSLLCGLPPSLQRDQSGRPSSFQFQSKCNYPSNEQSSNDTASLRLWQHPQTPVPKVDPYAFTYQFDTASCSPMTTSSSFAGSPYSASNLIENSAFRGAKDPYEGSRNDYYGNHSASLGTSMSTYSSPVSQDRLPAVPSHFTSEIVLRSTNGDRALDVYYPCAPAPEVIMYALSDPHRPSQLASNAGTARVTDGCDRAATQYAWNSLSPPRLPEPITQAARLPRLHGALPYTPPSAESYVNVSSPTKVPRRQDEKLRFVCDLYTPRWVRGESTGREGWCSLCEKGNWQNMKTSQYLYHVRSTHGVSSNTGRIYDPPVQLCICDDTFGSTYGKCGECHDWVPICTPRRKRSFTAWFKHAHQCHRMRHHHHHHHRTTSLAQNTGLLSFHEMPMVQSTGLLSNSMGQMTNLFQTYEHQHAPLSSSPATSSTVSPAVNSLPASLMPPSSDSQGNSSSASATNATQRFSWVNGPSATAGSPHLVTQPSLSSIFLRDNNSSAFNAANTLLTGHRRSTSDGVLSNK